MPDRQDPPGALFALEFAQQRTDHIRGTFDGLIGALADRCEGNAADPLLAVAVSIQLQLEMTAADLELQIELARGREQDLPQDRPGLLGLAETVAARAAETDQAVRRFAMEAMLITGFHDGPFGMQRSRLVDAATASVALAEVAGRSAAHLRAELEGLLAAAEVAVDAYRQAEPSTQGGLPAATPASDPPNLECALQRLEGQARVIRDALRQLATATLERFPVEGQPDALLTAAVDSMTLAERHATDAARALGMLPTQPVQTQADGLWPGYAAQVVRTEDAQALVRAFAARVLDTAEAAHAPDRGVLLGLALDAVRASEEAAQAARELQCRAHQVLAQVNAEAEVRHHRESGGALQ